MYPICCCKFNVSTKIILSIYLKFIFELCIYIWQIYMVNRPKKSKFKLKIKTFVVFLYFFFFEQLLRCSLCGNLNNDGSVFAE